MNVDAAAGGALMNKTFTGAYDLIEANPKGLINVIQLRDAPGGLVVVPDALAALVATALGMGGGHVISGSSFLFLNRIHNANQQLLLV
ncbi:transmembrane protein, putative [Medicago truncatula]|uniref:Transmembrane protein, putative n=1 Tax=Medicago truncatula TaxID=3880 RepID=A0A072THS4_MEDTR|nr:transmembrane protein, putative [Medicago truncatula]